MKSQNSFTLFAATAAVILSLAVASPALAQRQASGRVGAGNGSCTGGIGTLFDQIEPTSLSAVEADELVYLREEEKLARDVYLTLADRWQMPIFNNIAGAEQRHMDSVLRVLETYGVADPVVDDMIGVFTNTELGHLFTQLTQLGNTSLVDALVVGATIEDLDLDDLDELLSIAENDHVKLIAYNLSKGSRNHLRAFMRALTAQGGTYLAQYLDQETFDGIVASEMERRVVYGPDGEALDACGGGGRGGQGRRGQSWRGGPGSGSGTGTCTGEGPQGSGQRGGQGGGLRDGSCQS